MSMLPFLSPLLHISTTQGLLLLSDVTTSLIRDGDLILLAQAAFGDHQTPAPLLQTGFTSLFTVVNSDPDNQTGDSFRASVKIAAPGDVGAIYDNNVGVSIMRRAAGTPLVFQAVDSGVHATAGLNRPAAAAYFAYRNNAIAPGVGTVDGVSPDSGHGEVWKSLIGFRISLWSGDFWPDPITLADGTFSSSRKWLIVSRS